MTREIELTQGRVAIVDDADYDALARFKWCVAKIGNAFYARRKTGKRPHQKQVYMHRAILNPSADMQIDHIDGDGLNNVRANLRPATKAENMRNRGKDSDNTSGYKGVSFHAGTQKWNARIKVNGKTISLGYFDDPAEAARAYDDAALNLHGNFARINFQDCSRQAALGLNHDA